MLSINTNLSSMIAQNSMNTATAKLNQAIERMTTGAKINHAKDNAAGYSIATNMTTKMNSYMVAQDNAEMGMDMVTTAEENLSQMGAHTKRLRELATQARNGTYGKQSLQAMQEEANAIYAEINRLYQTAEYNGVKLFNQSEYDLPDTMPKADPITGFIEDPYDYTEEDLENITSIAKVKNNTFEESTYKIETVADLAKLAELTNAGVDTTGKTFVLANDLDLKEYCEEHKDDGGWTPIGTETNEFKGTFNGNGNVISNLTIERNADRQGLFGKVNAGKIIKNIGIVDIFVKGRTYIGGIAGYAGTIENCYALGEIISNSNNVGGIVGEVNAVKSSYSCVEINGNANYVGGIAGVIYQEIKDCHSNSKIHGNSFVGGLMGRIMHTSLAAKGIVQSCYSTSDVFSSFAGGSLIGGIVNTNDGINYAIIDVKDCCFLNKGINSIGGCYKYSGYTYTLLSDYDMATMLACIEEIELKNTSTNLQVGIKAESASQIDFDTNFELDLGNIVRNGVHSDSALSAIDDFIDLISAKETELGAVTNRLESVLDEIEIQYNNLASSRSTIRDADIAEVSSEYIKMQILQQASSTLLATANQTPSIALQLI